MLTIIVLSMFLGLLIAYILLWALFLRVGLRWAKVKNISARRVAYTTMIVFMLLGLANVLFLMLPNNYIPDSILLIADIFITVFIPGLVIMLVFKTSFFRTIQSWSVTLLTPIILFAIVFLFLRPFFFAPFKTQTNAMAPTILGDHCQSICSECGNPAFYTPDFGRLMICRDNFHMIPVIDHNDVVFDADHFLVAKFLKPRRWDIVVFRFPEDPSVLHVKRVVGLPGEEIVIKDGKIMVNNEILIPPDAIREIKYSSSSPWRTAVIWGSPDRPAKLDNDEYFVLGDFSEQSEDSRFWQRGAIGHNPFAVPESYLIGVVTHIYWPPSRWQTFR